MNDRFLPKCDAMIAEGNAAAPLGATPTDLAMVKVGYMIAAGLFSVASAIVGKSETTND